MQYTYDATGLRQSKTVNGVTTSHIWDGTNMIAETNGDGDVTNKYYRGLGLIYGEFDGNKNYYVSNAHGDVCLILDGNSSITKQYEYDAFGVELNKDNSDINPFRYCGEYYDKETDSIYLRARYYSPSAGRFITEDPIKDGLNWYSYCGGNPVMFIDPSGLEDIVVAGGSYHQGNGKYQYEFVDSALKKLSDIGGGTLLVANAGWEPDQITAINQSAVDAGVNLLWFSSVNSLTDYINNGGNGGRGNDPITSFTVYAHGTDADADGKFTGKYSITFGLYTEKDAQLRWYTGDISRINGSAFASRSVSSFYACRTGNTFDNGNFAQTWANKTNGETYAYSGVNGRSQYSDILGTLAERHSFGSGTFTAWQTARGDVTAKPGAAWRSPAASWGTSMTFFYSSNYQWLPAKPIRN